MALHVVIDGYNLIGVSSGLGDIEAQRDSLIKRLSSYRRIKGIKLTVIFDAMGSGKLQRTKEMRNGVCVVFTRAGETADAVIKEYAAAFGSGITVVTSDRDVASYSEKKGSVVISSAEFASSLDMCEYAELKGADEEEDRHKPEKGPSRRLSKKERLKLMRLKKL